MKKTILILISILIAVYIVLSVLGSGGEYAAEKLFYKAMKESSRIAANPDVAPPALVASAERDFKGVLAKFPKTNVAKTTKMALAEFYFARKKDASAIDVLDSIIKKPSYGTGMLAAAHFLKGIIYERQDKWTLALSEFATLRDKYTATKFGLQIPLYIGKHYTVKGDTAAANRAYLDAAAFYEKLERDNPKKMLGYMGLALSVEAYMGAEEYEKAGTALQRIINEYPAPVTYIQALPMVEVVYADKLKNTAKAIEIYKSVSAKLPDGKLKKLLDQKIAKLEAKK